MKIGDNEKMLAEKKDGVGWVTFNNPERRNAVSPDMWTAFAAIMDAYIADNDVHVVVLRGAGDKAFVSGADISQFEFFATTRRQKSPTANSRKPAARKWTRSPSRSSR